MEITRRPFYDPSRLSVDRRGTRNYRQAYMQRLTTARAMKSDLDSLFQEEEAMKGQKLRQLDESTAQDGLLLNCVPFCRISRVCAGRSVEDAVCCEDTPGVFKKTFSAKDRPRRRRVEGERGDCLKDVRLPSRNRSDPRARVPFPSGTDSTPDYSDEPPTLLLKSRMGGENSENPEEEQGRCKFGDVCPVCRGADCRRIVCDSVAQPSFTSARPGVVEPPGLPAVNGRTLRRIREFYRSLETDVITTAGLVNLYLGTIDRPRANSYVCAEEEREKDGDEGEWPGQTWRLVYTGVLICLLDSGHGRRQRQLQLILADPNTAFPLWKERVTVLSDYTASRCRGKQCVGTTRISEGSIHPFRLLHPLLHRGGSAEATFGSPFHYVRLSCQTSLHAGFCFDLENDADEFYAQVALRVRYCQDLDESVKPRRPSFKVDPLARLRAKLAKSKNRRISKKDISRPLCSSHLTSIISLA